jgi:hypothetical protein
MARGHWLRDPLTGLPAGVDVRGDLRARYRDCDLFRMDSIAVAAGYRDARYFVTIFTASGSPWHSREVRDVDGRVVGRATHTQSAEAGSKKARRRANAARGYYTDPSSGSG